MAIPAALARRSSEAKVAGAVERGDGKRESAGRSERERRDDRAGAEIVAHSPARLEREKDCRELRAERDRKEPDRQREGRSPGEVPAMRPPTHDSEEKRCDDAGDSENVAPKLRHGF